MIKMILVSFFIIFAILIACTKVSEQVPVTPSEVPEAVPPAPGEGKLKATDCTPGQRNAEVCTMEYAPVCGWFDPAQVQCIRYPCARTFSNVCGACHDTTVISWTQGECPP